MARFGRFRRYGRRFKARYRSYGRRFKTRYRSFRTRYSGYSKKKKNMITYIIGFLILAGAGFFVWKKFIKKV